MNEQPLQCEGLWAVDWERYAHYCGSMPWSIPDEIEKLYSADPEVRFDTRDAFGQWPIELLRECGQLGAVPEVVPFLLQIIAGEQFPDRGETLGLLNSWVENAAEFSHFTKWFDGEPDDLRQRIDSQFKEQESFFVQLLGSDDRQLREEAVVALMLIGNADVATALINHGRIERDPDVRYAMIRALGELRNPVAMPFLLELLDDADWHCQTYAAVALCKLQESPPEKVIEVLAAGAMATSLPSTEWPDYESDVKAAKCSIHAQIAVSKLPDESKHRLLDALERRLSDIPQNDIVGFCLEMARLFCDDECIERKEFKSSCLRVLRTIADFDAFWKVRTYIERRPDMWPGEHDAASQRVRALEFLNLPATREDLSRLLDDIASWFDEI